MKVVLRSPLGGGKDGLMDQGIKNGVEGRIDITFSLKGVLSYGTRYYKGVCV